MSTDPKVLKNRIAKRIARELEDRNVVNLGIGLPTKVANFIGKDKEVYLQSENGMVCMGPAPSEETATFDVVDAGSQYSSILPHGAFFDSTTSFGMIRGGHIDVCVLGALQVDQQGNLANWIIPGKMVPGMGGAMDLVTGAKKVIISTLHTNKGKPKILKQCTLPLTAQGQVNLIVTEMAVMAISHEGLVLEEVFEDFTVDDVREATEAELIIPDNVKVWKEA